jgi:hypothetical protein
MERQAGGGAVVGATQGLTEALHGTGLILAWPGLAWLVGLVAGVKKAEN